MSDLHGLFVNEEGIWVTSTLPDAVILYDFEGQPIQSVWFSETTAYPEIKKIDKTIDWRLCVKGFREFNLFHCNHVEVYKGRVFVTGRGGPTKNGRVYEFEESEFCRPGSNHDWSPKLVVDGLFGPHDGVVRDDGIWVTETSNSSVAKIGLDGAIKRRIRLWTSKESGVFGSSLDNVVAGVKNRLGKPGPQLSHWTRGLAVTDDYLYVGQSTWAKSGRSNARVLIVNSKSGSMERVLPIEVADYPEARIFQVIRS
jgi:hypothetical protein